MLLVRDTDALAPPALKLIPVTLAVAVIVPTALLLMVSVQVLAALQGQHLRTQLSLARVASRGQGAHRLASLA